MNVKMYTAAREATSRARNVASAIQQVQRQVNDDNKDISDKVDKNTQIRSKRKAELELAAADNARKLAAKQEALTKLQAGLAALQTVAAAALAVVGKAIDNKEKNKAAGQESSNEGGPDKPKEAEGAQKQGGGGIGGTLQNAGRAAGSLLNGKNRGSDALEGRGNGNQGGGGSVGAGVANRAGQGNLGASGANNTTARQNPSNPTSPTQTPSNATPTQPAGRTPGTQVAAGNQTGTNPANLTGPAAEGGAAGGIRGFGNRVFGGQGNSEQTNQLIDGAQNGANGADNALQKGAFGVLAGVSKLGDIGGNLAKEAGFVGISKPGSSNAKSFANYQGEGAGGAIAQIIIQLIEQLRKAAGYEVDGGLFGAIGNKLGQISDVVTTGSYTNDKGEKKDGNGLASALGSVVKPFEEGFKALGNGIGTAAGALTTGINKGAGAIANATGNGNAVARDGVGQVSGQSNVGALAQTATQGNTFTAQDANNFADAATQQLQGAKITENGTQRNLSAPEIQQRVQAGVQAIQAEVGLRALNTAAAGEGSQLAGVSFANSGGQVTANGVKLGTDVVAALAAGGSDRERALQTIQQAAGKGVLAQSNAGSTLSLNGNVAVGGGVGSSDGAVTSGSNSGANSGATQTLNLATITSANGGNLAQTAQTQLSNAGVTNLSVQGNNASATLVNQNGAATTVNLSQEQLQQIQFAAAAGLQVGVTSGANGQNSISIGTAAGGGGAQVSAEQAQQLAALAGSGLNVSVTAGDGNAAVIKLGTGENAQTLNGSQLQQLSAAADAIGLLNNSGVKVSASVQNGQIAFSASTTPSTPNEGTARTESASAPGVPSTQSVSLNESQLNQLAGIAGQLGSQGLTGASLTAGEGGAINVNGQSLSTLRDQISSARSTLGNGLTLGIGAQGITAVGASGDLGNAQTTLQALESLQRAGVNLDLRGAQLSENGVKLADGRNVALKDNNLVISSAASTGVNTEGDPVSSPGGSLTINAAALKGLSGNGDTIGNEIAQLAQAVNAGLALGQGSTATLDFNPNAAATSGASTDLDRRNSIQLKAGGAQASQETIAAIAQGKATTSQLGEIGVIGQNAALAQLASRGLSVVDAQISGDGSIKLKNGATINAEAVQALGKVNGAGEFVVGGNQNVLNAVSALGRIAQGQGTGGLQALTVTGNGTIDSARQGNAGEQRYNLSQIDIQSINRGDRTGQALLDNARVLGRGEAATSQSSAVSSVLNALATGADGTVDTKLAESLTRTTTAGVASAFEANAANLSDSGSGFTTSLGNIGRSITDTLSSQVDGTKNLSGQLVQTAQYSIVNDLKGRVDTAVAAANATPGGNAVAAAQQALVDGGLSRAEAEKIVSSSRFGNGVSVSSGALRSAVGDRLSVSQTTGNNNSSFNVNFNVATLPQGETRTQGTQTISANQGSVSVAANGQVTTSDSTRFAGVTDNINLRRNESIANSLNQALANSGTTGVSRLGAGDIQTDAAGNITNIRGQSIEEFAARIQSRGSRLDAAGIRQIASEGSASITTNLQNGGSEGISRAAQNTLGNLRAQGFDASKGNVTFDGKGGVTVTAAAGGPSISINNKGEIVGGGTTSAQDATAALFTANFAAQGRSGADATRAVGQFQANQDQIKALKDQINGAFNAGLFGINLDGQVSQLDVNFDASGKISSARATLDNNFAIDLSINNQAGRFAITGAYELGPNGPQRVSLNVNDQSAKQAPAALSRGAERLLASLRSGGLTGDQSQNQLSSTERSEISSQVIRDINALRDGTGNLRADQKGKVASVLSKAGFSQDQIDQIVDTSRFGRNGYVSLSPEFLSISESQINSALENRISSTASPQTGSGGIGGVGGIGGQLQALGATNVSLSQQSNTNLIRIKDSNGFNDKFTQEGRLRFSLGGENFNLGIGYDAQGGNFLNTSGLNSAQINALKGVTATGIAKQVLDSAGTSTAIQSALRSGDRTAALNGVVELLQAQGVSKDAATLLAEDLVSKPAAGAPTGTPLTLKGSNDATAVTQISQKLNIADDQAIRFLARSVGSGQLGADSVRGDDGRLLARVEGEGANRQFVDGRSDEQKANSAAYEAQITAAEGAIIRAASQNGAAGVRFATLQVQALLGDEQALALTGGNAAREGGTVFQRSDAFKAAVASGDTAKAQELLDNALRQSGLSAGSIKLDDLLTTPGGKELKTATQIRESLGSVTVQTGYDGRAAVIEAKGVDNGQGGTINATITQGSNGERVIDVTGAGNNAQSAGIRDSLYEQMPSHQKSTGSKAMDTLGEGIKYLAVALEAAMPGLQLLKKALEELQEIAARKAAAEAQYAAALKYAQEMGLTFGQAGGGGVESVGEGGGAEAGDAGAIVAALSAVQGRGEPANGTPLNAADGSRATEPGSPSQPVESGMEAQQGERQALLEQVAGDANFANIAVLLGQNPGLLIQQAQQVDMLERLAEVIKQLQSPFGNPVQEMQNFMNSLKAKMDPGATPPDATMGPL